MSTPTCTLIIVLPIVVFSSLISFAIGAWLGRRDGYKEGFEYARSLSVPREMCQVHDYRMNDAEAHSILKAVERGIKKAREG